MAIDVSDQDFASLVVEGSRQAPVVVDFWAAWCAPCRALTPVLERLAPEYGVTLAKVNVDENPGAAATFGVQGIPFVLAFKDGKVVDQFVGALPEPSVRDFFDRLRPSEADLLADEAEDAIDDAERERLYRAALGLDRNHERAILGLAALVGERGELDEAGDLLSRLPPTPEVERLRAELSVGAATLGDDELEELRRRVASDPFDEQSLLRLGRAEAAAGRYGDALAVLLAGVQRGIDDARQAMLDVFQVLGDDHELTREYRRKLAAALF